MAEYRGFVGRAGPNRRVRRAGPPGMPGRPGPQPALRRLLGVPGPAVEMRFVKVWTVIAFAVGTAFAVAALATGWLASRRPAGWFVDSPGERSLHDRPVSRAGGIAILAGLAAGLLIVATLESPGPGHGWILAGALAIVCISFVDDVHPVSPAIRIVFHLAAGGCVVLAGLSPTALAFPGGALELGAVASSAFTVLFVAWVVNLYNFMDGMDGFAGGMAAIGFTAVAVLCVQRDAGAAAAVGLVVAAASLGFLPFNFPPAKIFMGDLGSSLLGYLAAVMMMWAKDAASVPLWTSVLVFSPFIVDASITLVRRIIAGEKPWQPHRSHFYQRLVLLGWGHRKTVVREYGLMLLCAVSAVMAQRVSAGMQAALLGAWVAGYAVLIAAVTGLERRAGS